MDRFGPTGKFRKKGSTLWGGPLFPVGPVGILVEWIAPNNSARASRFFVHFFVVPVYLRLNSGAGPSLQLQPKLPSFKQLLGPLE